MIALALLAGCGDGTTRGAEPTGSDVVDPTPDCSASADSSFWYEPDDRKAVAWDALYVGVNALANATSAGVVVEVTAVSEPVWTGVACVTDERNGKVVPATPFYYRTVDARVRTVLYADDAVGPLHANDAIQVRVLGTGEPGGGPVGGLGIAITQDEIGGMVAAGDTVLVMLNEVDHPTPTGAPDRVLTPMGNYLGLWTIEEGMAVNRDPGRTVKFASLVERIEDERAAGLGRPTSLDGLERR